MTKQELFQRAKPMLLNTEMVQAILDNRKGVTRRLIKEKLLDKYYDYDEWCNSVMPIDSDFPCVRDYEKSYFSKNAPYQVGDYLYVRETWSDPSGEGYPYLYKADFPLHWDADEVEIGIPVDLVADDYIWSPSIHMPKEAARIFLRVTAVRAERLQEITEAQIKAEGTPFDSEIYGMPCNIPNASETYLRGEFMRLWDSTVKKSELDCCGWQANPWVWVIEFERVTI